MARLVTSFPSVAGGRSGPSPAALPFHRDTVVIHARARQASFDRHTAPLSIKAAFRGAEFYEVGGVTRRVEAGRLLILNADAEYASAVDEAAGEVESFCVFFADGAAGRARREFEARLGARLDDPGAAGPDPRFVEAARDAEGPVARALGRLFALARVGADPVLVDEVCGDVLMAMIEAHAADIDTARRLPPTRAGVRMELFHRLARARDFIDDAFQEPLSLERIAAVAELSVYHFARSFKARYGLSAGAYLAARRLDAARRRLETGATNVIEAAMMSGYDNPSAFARAFRRRFGLTPSAARAAGSSKIGTARRPSPR